MITEELDKTAIMEEAVDNNLAYLLHNDSIYVETAEGMVQIESLIDLLTLINGNCG